MKVVFEPGDIAEAFNADPEFRLCARFWNGVLEFGVGDRVYAITMADGAVAGVTVSDLAPLPPAVYRAAAWSASPPPTTTGRSW